MADERAPFATAICNRCVHLGDAPPGWRTNYSRCGAPVQMPAAVTRNKVKVLEQDRLIPNHILVGLSDTHEINLCASYVARHRVTHLTQQKGQAKPQSDTALGALLKPFKPETAHG